MKAMKKLMAVGLTLAIIITSIAALPVFAAEAEQTVPTPSYDWYLNAEAGTTNYTIETINDLAGLANIVNGTATKEDGTEIPVDTFSRKTIAFGTADLDIDMVDVDWTPIGRNRETNNFAGTFDGNGVTFSNLTIDTPETDFVGLFGYAWDGNFKNITMENPNITGGSYVGSIVGAMVGDVENCNVEGSMTSDNNIVTYGASVTGDHYVGGVVGWGYVDYTDCDVKNADITVTGDGFNTGDKGGGLAGFMGEGRLFNVIYCDITNVNVTGSRDIGGIIGAAAGGGDNTIAFSNCTVDTEDGGTSKIEATNSQFPPVVYSNAGGIIGRSIALLKITNCTLSDSVVIEPAESASGSRYYGVAPNDPFAE